MAAKFTTEAKVGIFVVLTIAALVYLTIRINKSGFSLEKSRVIFIEFDSVSGLLPRTPVEFAGIRVGSVNDIELVNKKARVEVLIDPKVPIYEDSYIALQNRGILGEKIITIAGGGDAPEIPSGGIVQASSSGGDFDRALANFNEIAQSIKDLIQGGDGKPSLRDVVSNVTDITEDLRTVVRGNRKELNDIVRNVNDFTTMLNNGDLRRIIENLRESSDGIRSFVRDADPKLKDVVNDFKNVMAKVDATAEMFNRIVAKVDRGEGTLGKLLSDETTVNKVNDTLDGINDFVGRVKRLEIAVGFRGEFMSTARSVQSVASFKFQPNYDKYFLFEFTDGPLAFSNQKTTITETSVNGGAATTTLVKERKDGFQFTALFAKRFYDLTLKAGLIRSSGGFGAEYHLFRDKFSIGFDAFSLNRDENPHVRLYAGLHLFKILHLTGGVDDVFHEKSRRNYFAGVGLMLTDSDLKSLVGVAPLVIK